uniref:Ribonuclease H-like domain-containing protein n=1 Tax=Tanacetum cinerariifolium TaxID=118510 RepID=A0A699Q879_TANCI|nr:ribonuclease H-like domain-containing protein [Tanacetum cinerariifolium]
MNDFCFQKRIKREFSNARTPQQNGVAERRNRTLIEAARTMLADAKLPVTFWAEAVNTACYVQNRVLVNKSQNKTPYEVFNVIEFDDSYKVPTNTDPDDTTTKRDTDQSRRTVTFTTEDMQKNGETGLI